MIDQNNEKTLWAVSSVDGITPVQLKADPVTGRMLIEIDPLTNFATNNPTMMFDQNGTETPFIYDTNNILHPLVANPLNSSLLIDMLIE